jgi:hypothetical protein
MLVSSKPLIWVMFASLSLNEVDPLKPVIAGVNFFEDCLKEDPMNCCFGGKESSFICDIGGG